MSTNDANSLTHYGILGMHWGVRKAEYSNAKRIKKSGHAYAQAELADRHKKLVTDLKSGKINKKEYHRLDLEASMEAAKRFDETQANFKRAMEVASNTKSSALTTAIGNKRWKRVVTALGTSWLTVNLANVVADRTMNRYMGLFTTTAVGIGSGVATASYLKNRNPGT